MTDIVERLNLDHSTLNPLHKEAADEITRLRQLLSEADKREREATAKALEDAAVVAERAIAEFTSDARAWASEKMPAAASQAKAQAKAAEMVAERIRALQSEER